MPRPQYLIIHHSGGRGDHLGVINTLKTRGLGAQYIIDRNGNIHSTGLPSRHIRPGQGIGSGISNRNSFGVEVIGRDDRDILPVQIEAAKRLREQLGIDPKNVYGHGEINRHKQRTEGQQVVRAIRGLGGDSVPRPPADIPNVQTAKVAPTKPKTIDITDTPTLASLNPPTKSAASPVSQNVSTNILKQMAPTEQAPKMARHPSFEEAIKASMTGNTENVEVVDNGGGGRFRTAAMFPPIRDKGKFVKNPMNAGTSDPRVIKRLEGPKKDEIKEGKTPEIIDEGPYERAAPGTRGMEGTYKDYVDKEKAKGTPRREISGETVKGKGHEPGTSVIPYDPNLPAQVDPATVQRITGQIVGRPIPPAGRGPQMTPGVAAATVATGLGADPALQAVQQMIAGGKGDRADAAPTKVTVTPGPGANVDPGTLKMLEQAEQAAGLTPGTLSGRNAGVLTSALPIVQQAFADPQTRGSAVGIAKKMISAKAAQDAQASQMQKDPTFYQRQAASMSDPSSPFAERAMMTAVARDYQQPRTVPRGMTESRMTERPASLPTQQPMPPQVQPRNALARPPQDVPPSIEQQIVERNIAGGAPDLPPAAPQYQHNYPMVAPPTINPAMFDPNAMGQLMQFYTGVGE